MSLLRHASQVEAYADRGVASAFPRVYAASRGPLRMASPLARLLFNLPMRERFDATGVHVV